MKKIPFVLISWYSSPYLYVYVYVYLVRPRYSNQMTYCCPACEGEKRGDEKERGDRDEEREVYEESE